MVLVMGASALLGTAAPPDPRHDFDFEVGTWTMSPSGNTHVVERLWEGATIARLIVPKPVPHVRGSLLTVYHPGSQRWYIYWTDATDGSVSPPLVGGFAHGIGTFVGPDVENGRHVLVRLVFSNVTAKAFQTVQSVSHDNGKTWDAGVQTIYARRS
jgi:hypothetical protein